MPFKTKSGAEFNFDDLRVGDAFWIQRTATKYHIRGIVDEHAVLRVWDRSARKWNYEIRDEDFCDAFFADGAYLKIKQNRYG